MGEGGGSDIPTPAPLDHEAVSLSLSRRGRRGKRGSDRWCLNTSSLDVWHFKLIIAHEWVSARVEAETAGKSAYEVWLHCKARVRAAAQEWSRQAAAARRRRRARAEATLAVAFAPEERRAAKQALADLYAYDCTGARIRAGIRFHTEGDRPTHRFFTRAAGRKRQSKVTSVRTADGELRTGEGITSEFSQVWGEVLGVGEVEVLTAEQRAARDKSIARIRHTVPPDAAARLSAPFSSDELTDALSRAGRGSAPGPDGLPIEFYATFWDVISPALLNVATAFHGGVALPAAMVEALIIFLAKTDDQSPRASQFRPISLLNADYKLLAAMLASRINAVLPALVHDQQTGFVLGRLIHSNLSFCRDLCDWATASSSRVFVAFLDFAKAFDKVSWSYRDEVMDRMGFPPGFIDMVRGLYAEARVRFNVNGEASDPVSPTRGVRQGCPLSPVLFALLVEPLGLLLRDLAVEGVVEGIRVPDCGNRTGSMCMTVSQFADDTTLYASTPASLRSMVSHIINEYCAAAGAQLNVDKSKVWAVGGDAPQPDPNLFYLPDQGGRLTLLRAGESVRALGGLYGPGVDPASRFEVVYRTVISRLKRWLGLFPSIMARGLLANAVISSCLWFFGSFIAPSSTSMINLDRVVGAMMWRKSAATEAVGRALVSRGRLGCPRSAGGLNVIVPSVMMHALRAQMVNRLIRRRGEWWTWWAEWLFGQVDSGVYCGLDALRAIILRPSLGKQIPSFFWRAAVKSWLRVGYRYDPSRVSAHREHAAAFPCLALAAASSSPRLLRAIPPLRDAGFRSLGDFWSFASLEWISPEQLLQSTTVERGRHHVPAADVRALFSLICDRCPLPLVNLLEQHRTRRQDPRAGDNPDFDHPRVGEVWVDTFTGRHGVVTNVDFERSGIDDNGCICEDAAGVQGDRVFLKDITGAGGFGARTASIPAVEWCGCSCTLCPALVLDDKLVGGSHWTWLHPDGFIHPDDPDLALDAPVRDLRRALHAKAFKSVAALRPDVENRWPHHLGVDESSTSEWEARWLVISRCNLSGAHRSLMWLILHRRSPLLFRPWISAFYQRDSTCLLCGRHPESFVHLFSDCSFSRPLWRLLAPLLVQLGVECDRPRAARLVGDITGVDVNLLREACPWPFDPDGAPPEPACVKEWFRGIWTDLRGIVLKAIWSARNARLFENEEIAALSRASCGKVVADLRVLGLSAAGGDDWEAAPPPSPPDLADPPRKKIFVKWVWGIFLPLILELSPLPISPPVHEDDVFPPREGVG